VHTTTGDVINLSIKEVIVGPDPNGVELVFEVGPASTKLGYDYCLKFLLFFIHSSIFKFI